MAGRRVLIVDDVITAGTAVRETVGLLRRAGAVVVGVAVCLDRQERVAEDCDESAVQVGAEQSSFKYNILTLNLSGAASSLQAVQREFGLPVLSIVGLGHLVEYLSGQQGEEQKEGDEGEGGQQAHHAEVAVYRQRYGV